MGEEQLTMPRHIAVIMDGNGRWAVERGLDREEGHRAGRHAARRFMRAAQARDIEAVSRYAFSTENWMRPGPEVDALMELFETALRGELEELCRHGVKLRVSGRRWALPKPLQRALLNAEAATAENTSMILNLCVNYGGQVEIVDAAKSIVRDIQAGKVSCDEIDEELFARYLYVPDIPPVDLLIRPGGALRVSSFMLWQIAYAEFYSMTKYWPDFQAEDLDEAIAEYSRRQRRFGGLVLDD